MIGKLCRAVAALVSAVTVAGAVHLALVRPWMNRWGANDDEVRASLPGDDVVPDPDMETTRAVTIAASADEVFSWLVQLGVGRGGFYSYDWLENAPGLELGVKSADRIRPELQDLRPGDRIAIAPGPTFYGYVVEEVRRPDAVVLHTRMHPFTGVYIEGAGPTTSPVIDSTWSFALRPEDPRWTRLVARNRAVLRVPPGVGLPYRLALEAVYFAMERRMLLGIRDRAERGIRPSEGSSLEAA